MDHTPADLSGDSLAELVKWQSGGELRADPDVDCTVRLHMYQAEIFAYEVRPASE